MSNIDLDNSRLEIPVSEASPGPSGIKTEPKEEDCEDSLFAFMVEPPPVKIENDDSSENNDEYESFSEDYSVDAKKLKTEHSEDSKEWLKNYRIKSEENDQLAVSGDDQDDDFTEDSNIKSEEMHIKEDDGINEEGMSSDSRHRENNTKNTTENFPKIPKKAFQCRECPYETNKTSDINRHFFSQHKTHKCNQCDFKTIGTRALNKHLLHHRTAKEVMELNCDKCTYKTSEKASFKKHLLKHSSVKFYCCFCTYKSIWIRDLRAHLLSHQYHSTQSKNYCNHCDYESDYKLYIKKHLMEHAEPLYLRCNFCDVTANSVAELADHIQQHRLPREIPIFKCNHCSYETSNRDTLKSHLRLHDKNAEFACVHCSYKSIEYTDIKKHLQLHVDHGGRFKCDKCDYRTNEKAAFDAHVLKNVTPERSTLISCHRCHYKAKGIRFLKAHVARIHKDEEEDKDC